MDVIGLGDMAVSNSGKTTFSIRMPSQGEIDFTRVSPKCFHQFEGSEEACLCGVVWLFEGKWEDTGVGLGCVIAVVHRDYTSNGSVQVMLFRDRLEITNPARLPRGWSIARFSEEHTSEPPNKVLAKPMQWAGYVEKAGTGTTDIIEKCVACGLRKPEYAFDGNTVKLTIWRTGAVTSPKGEVGRSGQDGNPHDTPHDTPHETPYDKITDGQRRLLQILLQADACGPAALRDALKIKDVSDFRERYLRPLMSAGLIEQTLPERKRSRLQRYRLTTEGFALVKSVQTAKQEGE